jgi:hypothetical protein
MNVALLATMIGIMLQSHPPEQLILYTVFDNATENARSDGRQCRQSETIAGRERCEPHKFRTSGADCLGDKQQSCGPAQPLQRSNDTGPAPKNIPLRRLRGVDGRSYTVFNLNVTLVGE